ncbi:MAG: hypothetical protein U0641_14805, partial [Anaerolineae bacterium]
LAERMAEQRYSLELSDAARDWLARTGYDPEYGARPLKRVIAREIESPLSREVLAGHFKAGDTVIVDAAEVEGKEKLVFDRREGAVAQLEDVLNGSDAAEE